MRNWGNLHLAVELLNCDDSVMVEAIEVKELRSVVIGSKLRRDTKEAILTSTSI